VTSLDMAGASVTVSLLDDQAKELWDAPVHTAALRWGGWSDLPAIDFSHLGSWLRRWTKKDAL